MSMEPIQRRMQNPAAGAINVPVNLVDQVTTLTFIQLGQPNTILDMSQRISTKEMEEYSDYGVKIYIDLHQLTSEDVANLQSMNSILDQLNKSEPLQNLSGEYQLGNIKVQIDSLDNITDSLIVVENYNE